MTALVAIVKAADDAPSVPVTSPVAVCVWLPAATCVLPVPTSTPSVALVEVPLFVMGAVTPTTPDEPVAPVAPVDPVDPVAPVAPVVP